MSADNWAICPKCHKSDDDKRRAAIKEASDAYGVEPVEVYRALEHTANNWPELKESLREDYQIGITDGEFFVIYSADCEKCSFQYQFRESSTLTP